MKTTITPVTAPAWVIFDAEGKNIGRLAVQVARHLRGKHKATFAPHQLCGDQVVVINAAKLALPPKKGLRKTYFRHTGHPGGVKLTRLDTMMEKNPVSVIEIAVKGMLPGNRLRQAMLRRLHVFADGEHPYAAQKPKNL